MKNGWTGGQYSIGRMIFGSYLFIHFVAWIPRSGEILEDLLRRAPSPSLRLFPNILAFEGVTLPLLVVGTVAAVLFTIGWLDRLAAVVMWYVLACLFGLNPLITNPSLIAGYLLLAHVLLPPAPFWSLAARGRVDPRGGWSMRPAIFGAAWAVMSLGYAYSGYTKLASPSSVHGTALVGVLELLYGPLARFRRTRPWIWAAMLATHVGLVVLIDVPERSLMMTILHLFTFDPSWIPPRSKESVDIVFYDGTCGLCHRTVRLLLAEDATGRAFEYAPLGSERFARIFPAGAELPDSIVVHTADEKTLVRSDAVVHLLHRLGGLWRVIGTAVGIVPRALRDTAYDLVARVRYRIFGRTKDACPLMPPDLRSRFST